MDVIIYAAAKQKARASDWRNDRSPLGQKRADECEKFLDKVSKGELKAVISKFTIHTIEALLNESNLMLVFLRNIQNSLGLNVYETSLDHEIAASMLMDQIKLDFDDALQYYVAKKLGAEAIVSYDKHFDTVDIYIGRSPQLSFNCVCLTPSNFFMDQPYHLAVSSTAFCLWIIAFLNQT